MKHNRNGSAPEPRPLVLDTDMETLDEESRRAWTEPMAVRPFGDEYIVECGSSDSHVVSLEHRYCTCSRAESPQCRHIRRVAIEINLGRIPAATPRSVDCACCGTEVRNPAGTDSPPLCESCRVEPGDVVVDTEGDPATPLLVVSTATRRADEVSVDEDGPSVAEYPGNEAYDPSEPVVEVVYPQSISSGESPECYRFPVSRLADPPENERRQAALSEFGSDWFSADE